MDNKSGCRCCTTTKYFPTVLVDVDENATTASLDCHHHDPQQQKKRQRHLVRTRLIFTDHIDGLQTNFTIFSTSTSFTANEG